LGMSVVNWGSKKKKRVHQSINELSFDEGGSPENQKEAKSSGSKNKNKSCVIGKRQWFL